MVWFVQTDCSISQAILLTVADWLQGALFLAAAAFHPQQFLMLRSWSPSLCSSAQSLQAPPNWMGHTGQPSSAFQRGAAARRMGRHENIEVSTTATCGQEAQRTNCSFKTSCVASRQGWEKKERETLPGDKTAVTTRMMAKHGLGKEKRLQHTEPLTGL